MNKTIVVRTNLQNGMQWNLQFWCLFWVVFCIYRHCNCVLTVCQVWRSPIALQLVFLYLSSSLESDSCVIFWYVWWLWLTQWAIRSCPVGPRVYVNTHCWLSGTFASRRWMKLAICFMLMVLVQSGLVCRLPWKLHLCLAIWCTPEALYL